MYIFIYIYICIYKYTCLIPLLVYTFLHHGSFCKGFRITFRITFHEPSAMMRSPSDVTERQVNGFDHACRIRNVSRLVGDVNIFASDVCRRREQMATMPNNSSEYTITKYTKITKFTKYGIMEIIQNIK